MRRFGRLSSARRGESAQQDGDPIRLLSSQRRWRVELSRRALHRSESRAERRNRGVAARRQRRHRIVVVSPDAFRIARTSLFRFSSGTNGGGAVVKRTAASTTHPFMCQNADPRARVCVVQHRARTSVTSTLDCVRARIVFSCRLRRSSVVCLSFFVSHRRPP